MRRELKFRAYSEQDAIMYQPLSLQAIAQLGHDFSDNIKLMQFTGLKDTINKNEVYEHDIINLLGIGFLKVEWDYRDTGWICIDKHYKKRNLVHVLLNGGIRVGNIWENPELLKEKEDEFRKQVL